MKEPTLFTLPDIPDDSSLTPIARIGSQSKLTKRGFSLSLLVHIGVLAILCASGMNSIENSPVEKAPPLQAYMVTAPQIQRLQVVPIAEPIATDTSAQMKKENEPSIAKAPPKESPPLVIQEPPVATKETLLHGSAFDRINERVKRVQAAQNQISSNEGAGLDELVAKLQKGRAKRDALFDTISEITTPRKGLEIKPLNEAPKELPEALSSQEAVGGMSMDPLFLYQSQIAEKIRSYIRSSSRLNGECKLSLSLSRDGHVIKINPLSGGKKICAASVKAALRANVFSMPKDDYLYQNLKKLTITVRMDENQTIFPASKASLSKL